MAARGEPSGDRPPRSRAVRSERAPAAAVPLLGLPTASTPSAGQTAGLLCEVYLRVDDVEAMVGRAEAAGARLVSGPAPRTWGEEVTYLTDPDGHVLAVARRR